MNTAETIIDLHKKSIKAEEYKSQLEKIYKICRTKKDNIASFVAKGHSNKLVIEQELKSNTIYMTFEEILGIINI